MLRHVILGGELNPFRKNLFLRAGFNFQRREDLKLDSSFNLSGFSWGLGFISGYIYWNIVKLIKKTNINI